jgi:hypothetical protein
MADINIDLVGPGAEIALAAAARAETAAGASEEFRDEAETAASEAEDALAAIQALPITLNALADAYRTHADAEADKSNLTNGALVVVLQDEDHSGLTTYYEKNGTDLDYVGPAAPVLEFAFASRPDPALLVGIGGVLLSGELYGIGAQRKSHCYSDGTRFIRTKDFRPAQSGTINYYIDSVGGSDGSAGTSSGAALETWAGVDTKIAALPAHRRSGLWIAMAKGSVWPERWSPADETAGVHLSDYGTGNPPMFACDDNLDNGDFALASGKTYTYQIDVAVELDTLAAEYPGFWEDDIRLTRLSTVNDVEAKPGTFCVLDATGSTITAYIHPYGSTNPTSDGKTYAAAVRRRGLDLYEVPFSLITGVVDGRRPYGSYGAITLGEDAHIRGRVRVYEGNIHSVYYLMSRDVKLDRIECIDCYGDGISGPIPLVGHSEVNPAGCTPVITGFRYRATYNCNKPRIPLSSVSLASTGVVTTSYAHGYANGDVARLKGDDLGPLNGRRIIIRNASGSTFDLKEVDTNTGTEVSINTTGMTIDTTDAWLELDPYASNVAATYNHGIGEKVEHITYIRPDIEYAGVGITAADIFEVIVVEPLIRQFSSPWKVAGNLTVYGGGSLNLLNRPAISGANLGNTDGSGTHIRLHGVRGLLNSTGGFQAVHANTTFEMFACEMAEMNIVVSANVADATIRVHECDFPTANARMALPYNFGASATGLSLDSDHNAGIGGSNGSNGQFVLAGATKTYAEYREQTGNDWASKPIARTTSTGWAASTGSLSRTTYTVATGQSISASPTQAQVQQIDNHQVILSQQLAALKADLIAQGVLSA